MLDGYESGMLSARKSCTSTELKRCIATEMRWNYYYYYYYYYYNSSSNNNNED